MPMHAAINPHVVANEHNAFRAELHGQIQSVKA